MKMDDFEIKSLVNKAKKKDREAFGQLFDLYHKPVFGYALKRVANVDLAQDIASNVFFKALKFLHQFKWQGHNSFSNWLLKIATNEINMHFRKNRNNLSLNDDELNLSERIPASQDFAPDFEIIKAQEEMQKKKDFLRVQQEMQKLKTEYQTVITLKYFERKKIEEISQILEKPEGTVKSWIHRGIQELREHLQHSETF